MPATPTDRRTAAAPARTVSGGAAERCQWCGAALDDSAVRLAGRARCARCGVATTDPVPSDAQLEAAYAGGYRPEAGRFSGPADALLRRSRGRLAGRIDRLAPPGSVLDVGAGDGALLDALAGRGREALGLERDSERADVRAAGLSEIEGSWAAVVLWHSLEHLREAGAALDRAATLLAPRGLLVVAMPNASSLQAGAFGDRWFALDPPRHLVHVPAAALLERLRERGLSVERVSHLRGGQGVFGWLHGLVGSLPGNPDLYDAIRRPEARSAKVSAGARAAALAVAALLLPAAVIAALGEAALRRGGSVYVEARRV
jgi:SAM-dependent methyltransferase